MMCLFAAGDTVLHTVHRDVNEEVMEDDPCPLAAALHEGGLPNPRDPKVTVISQGWVNPKVIHVL
jgi:hypothetical protein